MNQGHKPCFHTLVMGGGVYTVQLIDQVHVAVAAQFATSISCCILVSVKDSEALQLGSDEFYFTPIIVLDDTWILECECILTQWDNCLIPHISPRQPLLCQRRVRHPKRFPSPEEGRR